MESQSEGGRDVRVGRGGSLEGLGVKAQKQMNLTCVSQERQSLALGPLRKAELGTKRQEQRGGTQRERRRERTYGPAD